MPQLLDQYGRPIPPRRVLTTEQAGPTTTGVRNIWSGHPADGLTPRRLAALLRDSEHGDATAYLELAEQMEEKDLHYLGVIGTRKRSVAQLEITVDAASEAAVDVRNADLVRDWLDRDELEDDVFDILDAVGKAYSVLEIVWETSAREWRPRDLIYRDPRWFVFDRVDGRTLRLRGDAGEELELPPYKYVCHTAKAKSGLPIRGGLARAAAWSYLFKNFTVKDWIIFAEAYGQPLRVGKYHSGATDREREILLQAVASIGTDRAAIIPDGMMVDFVESSIQVRSDLYERLTSFLDQQVSKAVLGQTTTTDAVSGGHAVAREHRLVQEDIERADARALAATLNRDLCRPLVDLNYGPQRAYPRIRIGRPDSIDLAQMTDSLARLSPYGLTVRVAEVRERLGFADPEPGDEVLAPPAAQPPDDDGEPDPETPPEDPPAAGPPAAGPPGGGPPETAAARRDEPDSFDTFVDGELDEWEELLGPMVESFEAAIGDAETLEEARERLAGAIAGMDVEALRDHLARASFAGRVAGLVGASIDDSPDDDAA